MASLATATPLPVSARPLSAGVKSPVDGALGSILPSASFSPEGNYVFSECDVVGVGVLKEKRKLEKRHSETTNLGGGKRSCDRDGNDHFQ